MKKLTAEEFQKLSKEEKDKNYRNLAEGEMTRWRLLYDIPFSEDTGEPFEMTEEEKRKAEETLRKLIERDQQMRKEYEEKHSKNEK